MASQSDRGRVRDFAFGDQDHVNSDERVLHWWTFSADDDDSAPSEKSSSPHHSFQISLLPRPPTHATHAIIIAIQLDLLPSFICCMQLQ